MKRGMLLLLIILLSNTYGQTSITFSLDVHNFLDKNLFLPAGGEDIYVRGSFNNWAGEGYILLNQNSNFIYSNTFQINANPGDTIEYKFILKKADGRIYWERNPQPLNPDHGNRLLIITDSNYILPAAEFSYDEFIKYPVVFSNKKLREDYLQMRKIIEENHPALYDYTNKKVLDSLFEHYLSRIDTEMTFNEFYKIVSSVLERIGCGHTKLWIHSDYWDTAPQRFFPLKLYFSGSKVFVKGFYSGVENISKGSEIFSINGKPVKEIIKELKSITSSDAFIDAFKSKSVEKNFSPRYALYYGFPEKFEVEYILPNKNEVRIIDLQPADGHTISMNPNRGDELSLKILSENNAAILTINTFIYYDKLEMFKKFIDSSFQVIKDEMIKNLILDIRGNDGGDPFCSSYLLSYLEDKPVPYFAKIYGKYKALAEPIPLAENNFKGNLFTLIDGSAFSTTGHFSALLKYNKIGKLAGTETGATYTCTGSVRYVNLKNTRIILATARKQRYSAAVNNMDRTRGVLPDYFVEQTQEDLIKNKDAVLDFVLNLIGKKEK